jgi:hypothetical protein
VIFRDRFINTYADLLNTRFVPAESTAAFDAMVDRVAPEIPADRERWGGDMVGWLGRVQAVRTYLDERPGHVRENIVSEFGLPGTWDLTLDVDPPAAGRVALQAVQVEGAFQGTYFVDVPVTLTAEPVEGWLFVGWSGDRLGTDATLVLDPRADVDLVALFELDL